MRDKQARGKNPYSEDSESDAEPMRLGGQYVLSCLVPSLHLSA